ncbi:DUF3718 domain-containing protein [Colwelliaceae bacterium BS250]
MNIRQIIATLVVTNIAFFATAQGSTQYKFIAKNNTLEVQMCIAAATNNLMKLKQIARRDAAGIKDITRSVECNNQDITHFAATYGAHKTTKYLSRKAPKKYRVNVNEIEITDLARNSSSEKIQVIYVSSK